MPRQDRFIASFLLFQALAGAATLAWMALNYSLPMGMWLTMPVLIAASLVAGLVSLKQRRWAARLGMILFALQTPIFVIPSFSYSLWLGIHLDLAATWAGEAQLGVNLVGLVMYSWSSFRYYAPNNSFKPKPLRGSA